MAALLPFASLAPAQEPDGGLVRMARVEDPHTVGIGRVLPDLELIALRGEKHTISELLKDRKALVIAMTGATCPMSKDYTPRLAEMEREYGKRGVAFVYVNSVEAETLGDMQEQVKRGRFEAPYVPDRTHAIVKALGVRTTTEVFLIDTSRTLQYRGAVDDQHGVGKSLPAPKNTYLADAIEQVLVGVRPRVRATWSPGCLVSAGDGIAATPSGPATYTSKIAWIMAESCVSCHRLGGAAPFPLDSYDAVAGRAKMIEAVVRAGLMPPWHGAVRADADAPSPWVEDRSLRKEDKDALLTWLASDRPRGPDSAAPPPPTPLSRTWAIGEPDLLVTTSGLKLSASGGIKHARVIVVLPLTEDKWISAFEFRPVEASSIHHALVWILQPGMVLPQTANMPTGLEFLGSYSPGQNLVRYPQGTARRIPAGSIIVADIYAKPMGKELISALRVGMKFAPSDPNWVVESIAAAAAGATVSGTDAAAEANLAIPAGARVLALTPYMRSRGHSYSIDAGREHLIDAPHHDFRWVIRYEFAEPRELASISMTGHMTVERDPTLGSDATDESVLIAAEVLRPRANTKR